MTIQAEEKNNDILISLWLTWNWIKNTCGIQLCYWWCIFRAMGMCHPRPQLSFIVMLGLVGEIKVKAFEDRHWNISCKDLFLSYFIHGISYQYMLLPSLLKTTVINKTTKWETKWHTNHKYCVVIAFHLMVSYCSSPLVDCLFLWADFVLVHLSEIISFNSGIALKLCHVSEMMCFKLNTNLI